MKLSVLYDSRSGNTQKMAEVIARRMRSVDNMEAKTFSLDEIDREWVKESKCVVIGTPTYMASLSGNVKAWLEGPCMNYDLSGKLGGCVCHCRLSIRRW